ncbi:MAG: hypothetical protein ACRDZV_00215 [Acidimicrobiia bacterium]
MSALHIDARCQQLRRDVGPVAWLVLEELALDARSDGDALFVPTSVRELAAAVSLNKDTVARAVAVLVRLGVVEHHQPASGGRFGAGCYRLTLPAGLDVIRDDTTVPPPPHTRAHAATHARPQQPIQLTLLDLDAVELSPRLTPRSMNHPQPSDALAPRVLGAVHESRRSTHEAIHEPGERPC